MLCRLVSVKPWYFIILFQSQLKMSTIKGSFITLSGCRSYIKNVFGYNSKTKGENNIYSIQPYSPLKSPLRTCNPLFCVSKNKRVMGKKLKTSSFTFCIWLENKKKTIATLYCHDLWLWNVDVFMENNTFLALCHQTVFQKEIHKIWEGIICGKASK